MTPQKLRSILNILFLVGAAIAVLAYFFLDFQTFIYICGAAIFVKVVEFIVRFTN